MSELARLLGCRIREARKSCGLSLEKTAELADISLTFLGDVERGRKEPSIGTLQRIAKALSVSVREIIEVVDVEPTAEHVSKHEILIQLRKCMRNWYTVAESEAIYEVVRVPARTSVGAKVER